MLRLSEAGGPLILSAPAWIGLLILALGVALGVYVVRGKAKSKVFGAAVAALLMLWYGWSLLYGQTRFDETGVTVRGTFGTESVTAWSDVTAVGLEERAGGRGGQTMFLVLRPAQGPEVLVRLGGLEAASRVRLLEYASQRAATVKR